MKFKNWRDVRKPIDPKRVEEAKQEQFRRMKEYEREQQEKAFLYQPSIHDPFM